MFIDVEDIQGKLTEMVKSSTQGFNGLEGSDASVKFKDLGDLMKNTVPIISALRDPALEERHWEEINAILNTDADIHSDTFTLQSLIDLNLDQPAREQISEIALKASKEAELEQLFNKVQADWRFVKFDVNPYKDTKDYYVISSTEEVNEILEESLVALNTILTSRYADHIRQEVEEFNTKKLSYLELLIDEWMEGQKGWTYLESIFHSPDISK